MTIRPHVVLREADREDAAALIALWGECAHASGGEGPDSVAVTSLWREPGVAEAAAAIDFTLGMPHRSILVALVDGEVVGVVVFQITTITPINLTKVLTVVELHVSPRHRRRSVASSLLSAAATVGEENSCELVVAVTPAHAREPNRYLTKLGFSQVSVVRAIQASVLRSRLSMKATNSRDTGRLIAMRRTLRRRQGDPKAFRVRH